MTTATSPSTTPSLGDAEVRVCRSQASLCDIPQVMHVNRHRHTARLTHALLDQAQYQESNHHMQGTKTARHLMTKKHRTVVCDVTANHRALVISAALKKDSIHTFSNNVKLQRSTCAALKLATCLSKQEPQLASSSLKLLARMH